MTQAVKRACDACHRRKVRCNGLNPCRNCGSAQLGCTYNAIPQKKGPKGSRAKVISELRETQRQTCLSTKVQNRLQGIPSPPPSPNLMPVPGLVTGEFVKECLDFFLPHMYSLAPILDSRLIEHQVLYMEQNRDVYCMLASMCALTMLQPGKSMPVQSGELFRLEMSPMANILSSTLLVEEALRVRKGHDYLDSDDGCVSANTLATNYFLFACSFGIECHAKAWYYLREATTMMVMAEMHKEETYLKWDPAEAARRRRLYWLFYIAERSYSLQRQRPMTLQATINLPAINDDPKDPMAHQLNNLIMQANLFKLLDDKLVATWVKTRSTFSQALVSSMQKQLNEVLHTYMCQDSQVLDFQVNQQWLKSTLWQLDPNCDDNMGFQYSMDLSREMLMSLATAFPGQGADLIGSGLIEKLLEICHGLNEYLWSQPASRNPLSSGPREYANQILNIVAVLRNGGNQFLPLLLVKLTDVIPRLANPIMLNAPDDSHLASIDIFDGFGNAGMAQSAMMMDSDYDRKFSIADYDRMSTLSESTSSLSPQPSNSVTSAQASDLSFVTTPGLMSPGLEFPHPLSDFTCSPIGDLVVSPLSAGPGPGLSQSSHHAMQAMQSHCMPSQGLHGAHSHALGLNGHGHGLSSVAMAGGPTDGGGGGGVMLGIASCQQPHRPNSFAMPAHQHGGSAIPRSAGEFRLFQRTNSESSPPTMRQVPLAAGLGADVGYVGLR